MDHLDGRSPRRNRMSPKRQVARLVRPPSAPYSTCMIYFWSAFLSPRCRCGMLHAALPFIQTLWRWFYMKLLAPPPHIHSAHNGDEENLLEERYELTFDLGGRATSLGCTRYVLNIFIY